jgi:hypothetical protein
VLDVQDGKTLIITDMIIKGELYHWTAEERNYVTWENSSLREYLNGEFYNSFNSGDREKIIQATNANPDNPRYDRDGGNDTDDYIFLLSLDEVVKYFGDSGQLYQEHTGSSSLTHMYMDDEYNENRIAHVIANHNYNYWWLRSLGGTGSAANVGPDGVINVYGFTVGSVNGVRPALWLRTDTVAENQIPEPPVTTTTPPITTTTTPPPATTTTTPPVTTTTPPPPILSTDDNFVAFTEGRTYRIWLVGGTESESRTIYISNLTGTFEYARYNQRRYSQASTEMNFTLNGRTNANMPDNVFTIRMGEDSSMTVNLPTAYFEIEYLNR